MTTNTNAASVAAEPHRKALAETFQSLSDRAYCNYIEQMRRPECLGWEEKVRTRRFGTAELEAHTKAGAQLGRHKAFQEAANAMRGSDAPIAPDAKRAFLALRTIAEYPAPEQDDMQAANMRKIARDALASPGAVAAEPTLAMLTPEEVDLIANDGLRNVSGGIYATQVHAFAEAIQLALAKKNPTLPSADARALGMSLRDHFAGLAMQSQLVTDAVPGEACDALVAKAEMDGQDPVLRLAYASYEVADAMLCARRTQGVNHDQ